MPGDVDRAGLELANGQPARSLAYTIASAQVSDLIVAYEPVWAIGTGRNATAAQAENAHAHIRGFDLSERQENIKRITRDIGKGKNKTRD